MITITTNSSSRVKPRLRFLMAPPLLRGYAQGRGAHAAARGGRATGRADGGGRGARAGRRARADVRSQLRVAVLGSGRVADDGRLAQQDLAGGRAHRACGPVVVPELRVVGVAGVV